MEQILKNKKIVIVIALVLLLAVVVGVYMMMPKPENPDIGNTPPVIEGVNKPDGDDIYIRDENGNIKNVLVIDTEEYSLQMDLLGTWKEYLLPVDERDRYQAFMIPSKVSEVIPYFYVLIEESPEVNSEALVEEEIIYSLKKEFDSFELEQILKKAEVDGTRYSITYNTVKNREETKNYLTIFYQDGYKISFTYSALDIAYAAEKGYIDDMIKTVVFQTK